MLKKVIQHFHDIKYMNISEASGTITKIELLKLGNMLHENIKRDRLQKSNEKKNEIINFSDKSSLKLDYLNLNPIKEGLKEKLDNLSKGLPPSSLMSILNLEKYETNSVYENFLNFNLNDTKAVYANYLVPEMTSSEMFYKICRQRKIWWMSFASNPGYITTSNLENSGYQKLVTINKKTPEFEIELERIELSRFENNINEKFTKPLYLIDSLQVLPVSAFAFLVDAYQDLSFGNSLMLHRKISPYKIAIFCEKIRDVKKFKDIKDLCRLIEIDCSKNEIETLNLAQEVDGIKTFAAVDQIGVPYSVLVEESSLSTGLLKLRNRNTTLCETIHISDIPSYLIRIFSS